MKKSALLLLMVLTADAMPAEEPVKFADPNIKAVVEIMLKVSDPVPTQMRDLYVIQCRSKNVKDLAGIEYAVNLTELDLIENQVSDISLLADLVDLRHLGLDRNRVGDLSALSGLTNLKRLTVRNNQVSDIRALAGLTNLEYLDLRNNQISDISALAGLTKLRYLNLNYNEIGDISALSRLTELGALFLDCYYISDIWALSQLKKLRTLHLNYNEISDIRPLSKLTGLEYLELGDNPLNKAAYETYLPLIRTNNPRIQLRYNLPRKDDALRPLVTSERPLPTVAPMAAEVVRARATSKAKIVKRNTSHDSMASSDGSIRFCRYVDSVDCRQTVDVCEVVMGGGQTGKRVLEYGWFDSDTYHGLTLEKPIPSGGGFILLLDEQGHLLKALPDNKENIEAVNRAIGETRTNNAFKLTPRNDAAQGCR